MGAGSPETRSIPRNRKCGNCRFYEPAPLWRKGWCRNPKLYPPHSNHLVDSTTIDCEGGFRSRIYWESIPLAEVAEPIASVTPAAKVNVLPAEQVTQVYQASPPPPIEQPTLSFRAPTPTPPAAKPVPPVAEPVAPEASVEAPPQPAAEPYTEGQFIEILRVDGTDKPPGFGPDKDWRLLVRQRAPFTQAWPLEKIQLNQRNLVAGAAGAIIGLIILLMLLSNLGKQPVLEAGEQLAAENTRATVAQATARAQATQTARSLRPTATSTTASAAAAARSAQKTALVTGVGDTPLNMREAADIKAKAVATVKEGEQVVVLEGPKEGGGRTWYKIEYKGTAGWAVKDYLKIQN